MRCNVVMVLTVCCVVSMMLQALVLVLRSMAMKRLHDIDQSEDSVAVDDYGMCMCAIVEGGIAPGSIQAWVYA